MKATQKRERIKVNGFDILKAFWDTAKNVLPIVLFLCIFQLFILKKPIQEIKSLAIGILLSITGLHLFLKGISLSLLPLGDFVGKNLVLTNNKYFIAIFAFGLGAFCNYG